MTEIIIDDGETGYSTVGTRTTYSAGEGISGDVQYAAAGSGASRATRNFGNLSGDYEIYIHYTTHSNRATNAPFTVKSHIGVLTLPSVSLPIASISDNIDETGAGDVDATTIIINQERDNNGSVGGSDINSGYVYIGTYSFDSVDELKVILSNNANEYVIADAVKIIEVTSLASISGVVSVHNIISLSL